MEKLIFYKIDPEGPGLSKANVMDIAYDLHSTEDVVLKPGHVYKIHTNIKIRVPDGTYGRVAERSGLASKGIKIGGGVIDPNYTGEIICIVSALEEYTVHKKDKIAQLILEKACICSAEESLVAPEPVDSRGENGLGSTGK